jgi:hypothetical protein
MSVEELRIPASWEFPFSMYDAGVEMGIPFEPASQPDAVAWLNDRILYWTATP